MEALHAERTPGSQTEGPVPPEQRTTQGVDTKEAIKEQAGAIWNDTKDKARSQLNATQQEAARGIGDFAGALRKAADQVDGDRQAMVGRFAQSAAEGLERISENLRTKDAATMMHDVESFARAQPVVFLAAAFTAGFFAVRFLKSSADEPQDRVQTSSTTDKRT